MKKIYKNSQKEITEGINELNDIVAPTLGANGQNVIVEDPFGKVQTINDGATIINSVILEKEIHNVGATLAKQVAEKTNEEAGDGTTTSIVLLNAFLNEMNKIKRTDLRNCREELKKLLEEAEKYIDSIKIPLKDNDIEKVAYISSLDKEVSHKIKEIITKIGKDGIIEIAESKKVGISSEIVKGIRIEKGYSTQLFADSSTKKAVFDYSPVLVSRKKLSVVSDIVPLMQALNKNKINKLVIFCEDISEEVLTMLVLNKVQGQFNSLVVITDDLDDIATITGAKIIDEQSNPVIGEDSLGGAEKIVATKYRTTVINDKNKEEIETKIQELKGLLKEEEVIYEKETIKRKIARLKGGISILKVGGENEQATQEKKLKVEDAVNAVKSAQEEGIIEGGGVALMRLSMKLDKEKDKSETATLFKNVIQSPYKQILANANIDYNKIDLDKLSYNTKTEKYENFIETGVIDPAKVTKSALKNAFSMGMQILTAKSAIINVKDKK